MAEGDFPKVSFIIPVLNAAGILENCLQSIRKQDYPQDKLEIIVGDAGSTDGTRELAQRYGAIVADDKDGRNIEDGKRAALVHATGDYVVFIDADNEIAHPDYIRRGVEALAANPNVFGVESYYLPSPRMTSFCSYLTCLLHISDPVAWMMSIKPVFVGENGEVETWKFPERSLAYPVGSNGFIFRKTELDLAGATKNYSDTHTSVNLIQATGKREWLRIKSRGVHHYYVATLGEFLKKRRRATCHFLDMQKEHGFSWTERKPRIPGWLACALCVTFIAPVFQMLIQLARTRDLRWLWHPWASFFSALGVLWGLQTYAMAAKDKKLIHKLQPRQKLEIKS
ncbi:MAG TPA: glycosyltransferase [Verrucomicrobiae bacterium]|nr:glycosyltransferase [Verrucomicrobiae bacterium]